MTKDLGDPKKITPVNLEPTWELLPNGNLIIKEVSLINDIPFEVRMEILNQFLSLERRHFMNEEFRPIENKQETVRFDVWQIVVSAPQIRPNVWVRNISFARNPVRAIEYALKDIMGFEHLTTLGSAVEIKMHQQVYLANELPPFDPEHPED